MQPQTRELLLVLGRLQRGKTPMIFPPMNVKYLSTCALQTRRSVSALANRDSSN
jgi:hypothetical protein